MSKSTRHDKNYRSWDNAEDQSDDPPRRDVVLDPASEGWAAGSWQDTAKFYRQVDRLFENIEIVTGGTEDAMDVSTSCTDNDFWCFTVAAGDLYILTLKGGCHGNTFAEFTVTRSAPVVDIEIGNWSSSDFTRSTGNEFIQWKHVDDKPITYCYRWGCKPKFFDTKTKHLWWRSIGLSFYWWGKFIWHRKLNRPDL